MCKNLSTTANGLFDCQSQVNKGKASWEQAMEISLDLEESRHFISTKHLLIIKSGLWLHKYNRSSMCTYLSELCVHSEDIIYGVRG